MDDVKGKMKDIIKKANKPFSSSSTGKFKGKGHVLGSSAAAPPSSAPNPSRLIPAAAAPPSSAPNPSRLIPAAAAPSRPTPASRPAPAPAPALISDSASSDRKPPDHISLAKSPDGDPPSGFAPFDSLITTSRRSANGCTLAVFECPVCGLAFPSEDAIASHIDGCLTVTASDVGVRVSAFLSAALAEGALEVVMRLLRNVAREPGNDKFRRIRMGNPKIKEAVGEGKEGVELLEFVGFRLGEDGGEVWATMEEPNEDQVVLIKEAVSLLERCKMADVKPAEAKPAEVKLVAVESPIEPKKIDRQVRVFFSVPENVAVKVDLPPSFYERSSQDIRREAEMRKKKFEESQLLIPKSFREKQAMAARKKYNSTVIRIQFPDGVALQGTFSPREPTTVLYEFVRSALKEGNLEFELLRPAVPRPRVISCSVKAGGRTPTLEEEELVPSALVKFKPMETDSVVFTGLSNELLEASEPLPSATTE